ncbi:YdgA family protein [Caldimonas thermodepolymerans]|uniref:Uncharacterized protein n=1 Tax=Caldimonas thermodepolymerans TaxID=215580 RepID=A0A2S5T0N3_9BURK|nr:YdgA family protein [Caldimonas thermodepolymerans]PPE68581.1 hypothetical protein C1702_16265 [Caldimonas thermodepolymerans]QPC32018.1 YdgA family protein [Caldimonas thermodepolymerans]RDI01454.1 uncharacterized protein YdgA (DUF945 family) [Caldimonas thermodepolymerans]
MKKTLLAATAVVVALGAAYVGSSHFVGRQVQQHLRAQTDRLTTQMPFIKVTEQGYERGLFASTRTVSVQLGCDRAGAAHLPGRPPGALEFTLRDRIRHGPLLEGGTWGAASVQTELVLPPALQSFVVQTFNGQPPLSIRTTIGFDRRYDARVVSPRARLEGKPGQQVVWQGLQGRFTGGGDDGAIHQEISMPGLEMSDSDQGVRMVLSELHWKNDGRLLGDSAWLMASGRTEGRLGLVEMNLPLPMPGGGDVRPFLFALTDLTLEAEGAAEQDLLHTTSRLHGSGSLDGVRLDRIELVASVKRVHAPSYQHLVETLMQQSFSCEEDEEADPLAQLAALQSDLMQLLRYDPEYAVEKLAVESGGQRGEVSYAFGVQGVTEADKDLPPLQLLATRARARADVSLPVAWIARLLDQPQLRASGAAPEPEMLEVLLDQFADQGYLVRRGEHVTASVRYEAGRLLLNGQPLPIGRSALR